MQVKPKRSGFRGKNRGMMFSPALFPGRNRAGHQALPTTGPRHGCSVITVHISALIVMMLAAPVVLAASENRITQNTIDNNDINRIRISENLIRKEETKENWERFFGGHKRDTSFSIAAYPNGDTISAGYTRSGTGADADILWLRLDKNGNLLWQKTWGGQKRDMATSVATMPDGGFVTAALSQQDKHAEGDALIMRHDKNGRLIWKKFIGGEKYDIPYAIRVSRSGNIIVAGYTKSAGKGDADGWVFSLNKKGKLLWEHTFGTKGRDWLRAMTLLPNGHIAVAGGTKADKKADSFSWVMLLDRKGRKIWSHIYRFSENVARAIIPLKNGKLAIAGWVHAKNSITGRDIWIARLDADGRIIWQKKLGGSGDDHTEALIALPGGDIALAGGTTRNLAVITVRAAWMLRLDKRGKLMWRRSFEGKSDQLYALASLPDGHLAAAGASWRKNRGSDAWILTLNKNGRRGKIRRKRRTRTTNR